MAHQQVGPSAKQSPDYTQYSLNAQRAIKGNVQDPPSNLIPLCICFCVTFSQQPTRTGTKVVLIIRWKQAWATRYSQLSRAKHRSHKWVGRSGSRWPTPLNLRPIISLIIYFPSHQSLSLVLFSLYSLSLSFFPFLYKHQSLSLVCILCLCSLSSTIRGCTRIGKAEGCRTGAQCLWLWCCSYC